MAEVFVGEAASVQGFKKQVAIKRVLPHLAQNKKFIRMFLDEARLSARLNHANIVSVFDVGAADDTYFIVMEYVEGANLKRLIEHYHSRGETFPFKEALYICMEACRGLSYAHELADESGEPLYIVHRDVSPPNILITKRGETKLADFGLAKANNQLEKTDPGVVKGKFSYLAPEAAHGEEVDARADVFSLGIVLWEMLSGRRLFLGETDYQTVKLVQQANIPRLGPLNPEVTAEFEEILHTALARDPDERFESAREFGDALTGFLFSHQLKVTPYDLAALVQRVMGSPQTASGSAQDQSSMIDRLIQEELVRFTSIEDMSQPSQTPSSGTLEAGSPGSQPLDTGALENPAEWFSDEDLGGLTRSSKPPADRQWRESGMDLGAVELEPEAISTIEPPAPEPSTPAAPQPPPLGPQAKSAPARPPAHASPASTAPTSAAQRGGHAKVAVVVAATLVLIAGVAVAWFGNLIPH